MELDKKDLEKMKANLHRAVGELKAKPMGYRERKALIERAKELAFGNLEKEQLALSYLADVCESLNEVCYNLWNRRSQ